MKELEIRLNENNVISFHDYIETRIAYEKLCKEKDKEIERLNNIINEIKEVVEEKCKEEFGGFSWYIKNILDKVDNKEK